MAGVTVSWDDSTPAGSEAISNGDNRIRELKEGVAQRLRNGGHGWTKATTDGGGGAGTTATDGRHICGLEALQGGSGAATGEFYLYAADGTTKLVTVGDSSASSASRITATTLTAYFANQRTLAIALNPATGVQGGIYFENRAPKSITILGAKLVAGTAPSGTSLVLNVFRNASGYTDPGSGGTTIFTTPASDCVITAGNRVGSETTAIVGAQSVLAQGDALYFQITTLSSAADIVVYIRCQ